MSSQTRNTNPDSHLYSVPGTGTDFEQGRQTRLATPRDWFIGGLATAVIAGGLAEGRQAVNIVSNASEAVVSGAEGAAAGVESLFTPDGKPKGISVMKLQGTKYKIGITPDAAMAGKGPSELGELVDPGVYQGKHSNSTTTANLNYEIAKQHDGILPNGQEVIKPGLKYQVPSIPEGAPDSSTH